MGIRLGRGSAFSKAAAVLGRSHYQNRHLQAGREVSTQRRRVDQGCNRHMKAKETWLEGSQQHEEWWKMQSEQ